ncbi:hypothetical protein N7471_011404 [Penicillium samsonianum]|uniref:uncharacterized protein n=1 Tax=Penicillium samsonianum TaxID=1882272 RepID=UPI0025472097|nr:uncharacterized protein N7471_011404 [Penicillium samsonianum]KAJ6124087.1 hypothetical protein N7471_011404 [Penicillium samsonianum]
MSTRHTGWRVAVMIMTSLAMWSPWTLPTLELMCHDWTSLHSRRDLGGGGSGPYSTLIIICCRGDNTDLNSLYQEQLTYHYAIGLCLNGDGAAGVGRWGGLGEEEEVVLAAGGAVLLEAAAEHTMSALCSLIPENCSGYRRTLIGGSFGITATEHSNTKKNKVRAKENS